MNLIVETDIGHDADDFFAICYLISVGVNIRTILITPGDPDQVAIARFICKQLGLDIPIGVSKENRTKNSSGSIHHALLKKYKYNLEEKPDGLGVDILENVVSNYPDSELFVIGPVTSIAKFMNKNPQINFKRATMQGGFCPYSLYEPRNKLDAFKDAEWMPTFNLNGDRPAGVTFLTGNIEERQMVGKNVCHGVLFDKEIFGKRKSNINPAFKLFEEAAIMYFERHEFKKFHDPTAACCHVNPNVGRWIYGNTVKKETGWTTQLNEHGDLILVDIDYDLLWNHILGV